MAVKMKREGSDCVYFLRLGEVEGVERICGTRGRLKSEEKGKGTDGAADGRGSQGDAEINKGSESERDVVGEHGDGKCSHSCG